nr:hypothetical protein CFP56_43122 [Quercus suber]
MGDFVSIDWQPTFPRNIRFMRIRVKIDPWLPLIAGFILKRDDRQYTWVECRYERVFKICKRCGIIGHACPQCHMDMFDIEELLREQAYHNRVQYPIEFALDLMKIMYIDDIRAFRRHPSHRTIRIRYDASYESERAQAHQLHFRCAYIHNLPLEYHDIYLVHFIGNLMGDFVSIDWQPTFPRNIRFMRIRVKIDPWLPLIAGFILKRDDRQYTWVECRYERVFKICKRCGIIGHACPQCHMDMFDIEELLREQAYHNRVQYPIEFALDLMKIMYIDDIRAFRRHPSHRTIRIRYDASSTPSPAEPNQSQTEPIP